jgi:hypothetical protein
VIGCAGQIKPPVRRWFFRWGPSILIRANTASARLIFTSSFPHRGGSTYTVDGTPIALGGMKTACGAALIASGPKGVVVS